VIDRNQNWVDSSVFNNYSRLLCRVANRIAYDQDGYTPKEVMIAYAHGVFGERPVLHSIALPCISVKIRKADEGISSWPLMQLRTYSETTTVLVLHNKILVKVEAVRLQPHQRIHYLVNINEAKGKEI